MITAVDSNVLLDVFGADATYGERSRDALARCIDEGGLVACEIVWAEVATFFRYRRVAAEAMRTLGADFSPMEERSALAAADSWRRYRRAGGRRTRVVADFLVGAHARVQADRLLTRDRGFYRTYFRGLRIVDPAA